MANEESRAQALEEIAKMIEAGGAGLGAEHAHQIRKYVKLVGERDAGPSEKVKEENTKLVEANQALTAELTALRITTEDYKVMRESAIRNQRTNDGLRESNTQLTKRNAELVKKHDEMVDLYAQADVRAKGLETALNETTAANVELKKQLEALPKPGMVDSGP